jgi:hypothetical protein
MLKRNELLKINILNLLNQQKYKIGKKNSEWIATQK